MKNKMINFNVAKYNDKMTKFDNLIDTLNEIIYLFDTGEMDIDSDFFKRLMDRPAEMFDSYINYEEISLRNYSDYDIKKDDYNSPCYEKCYKDIASEMITILEAYNKFYTLLPDIKEAYNRCLFVVKEENGEAKAVKTRNAELRIMQQCAEYTDTDRMD